MAIVIPMSTRAELEPDEHVSLRHLRYYLGRYDKYLVAPKGLPLDIDGCNIKYFPKKYFGSAAAHARMLYDPAFYRAFEDYEFIFFYHLDSLAFSDQLESWCSRDIDYIGAPWIHCPDAPWVTRPRVGNCGFALLRVRPALAVLYNRYRMEPLTYWLDLFTRNGKHLQPVIRLLEKLKPIFPRSKLVNVLLDEWHKTENPGLNSRNTDLFWSDRAVDFLPEFRVASLEEGLRFAFEVAPRTCFEMNGKEMPFGCHAWARYDRSFWEPYLLASETVRQERCGLDNVPESAR